MNKIVDFIIDSINASRDRLKMSIVTFYIALLALFHWRVFAILFFGGLPMMEKICEIDALYSQWEWYDYILNPVLVLLVSVLSMILFPTIMLLTDKLVIKIAIKRKNNKELEDDQDREKEIKIVQHQFRLKQEETGNLQQGEYLNKIQELQTTILDNSKEKRTLEKDLKEEREKQKTAILNLKNGFDKVESNYKQQIEELNRQINTITLQNIPHTELLFEVPANINNMETRYRLHDINEKYLYLSLEDKKFLDDLIYTQIDDLDKTEKKLNYNIKNNETLSYLNLHEILISLTKIRVITKMIENRNQLNLIVNLTELRNLLIHT
ncbi:hypothetical protein ACPDHL_12000 [Myroides sp. C15-4]|uniref:hypothetical protein n=1 Tax=Myroides sp. C15-4 TaxID=3400532 RepID=UPI003D2F54CE